MKKTFVLICVWGAMVSSFAQSPISIEKIINEIDWGHSSESDAILAFKDNVVKREVEETWDGGLVSSFILKNVIIGNSMSDANIIVNKQNRKLRKIGGISIGKDYDWSKGVDKISKDLEDYFSSFWGKEYKKSIEYDADLHDEKVVYTNITCEWGDTFHNDKTSKGSFLILHRAKVIVISVEPK